MRAASQSSGEYKRTEKRGWNRQLGRAAQRAEAASSFRSMRLIHIS
jgi:hypothetical protein